MENGEDGSRWKTRRDQERGLFGLKREKKGRDLFVGFSFFVGGYREGRTRLFV